MNDKISEILQALASWPLPKIEIRRKSSRQYTHASGYDEAHINCYKSCKSAIYLHVRQGNPDDMNLGSLIAIYESAKELVADGWYIADPRETLFLSRASGKASVSKVYPNMSMVL